MTTDGPRHRAPDGAAAPTVRGAADEPTTGRHSLVPPPPETPLQTDAGPAEDRQSTAEQPAAPEPRPRRRHAEPAPRSRVKAALIAVLGLLALAVGIGVGVLTFTTRQYEAAVSRVPDALPTTGRPPAATGPAAGSMTFVFTAVEPDRTARTGLLADSVMLVRLTADDSHAQVVFLPLDMWLTPQGQAPGTVGGDFHDGGPARLVAAVETVSGVRVDHYAQLDFTGFATVTDAVGGIDVTIPAPYDGKGQSFAAGPQHLDGAAALAYVRASSDQAHATDAAREQLVMRALFDRLGKIGALSDLGTMTSTIGAVSSALSVDSSLDDPGLVRIAWDHRSVGVPAFLTAPVGGRGVEGGQPVALPGDALDRLWADLRADDLAAHLGDFG